MVWRVLVLVSLDVFFFDDDVVFCQFVDGVGDGDFDVVVWCGCVFWCDGGSFFVPSNALDETFVVAVYCYWFPFFWPGILIFACLVEVADCGEHAVSLSAEGLHEVA